MRTLILITSLLATFALQAQQFSMPSQIQRNLVYINPAYTGIYETTVASLMHRSNWIGMSGNLSFQNFEIHSPLKNQSIALGLQARHEQIGVSNSTEFFFNYGHRISMGEAKLAFGIKGGIYSKSLGDVLLMDDATDPAFDASKNQLVPNFGFGVSYYSEEYFIGFSIPYFLSSVAGSDGNATIDYNMQNFNYILSAGGKFKVNPNLSLEPVGALIYSVLLKPSYSIILNANYNNMINGGIGYRSGEAIIFNVGYQVNNQISFMYSYDYNIGYIGAYSRGSHEIGLLLYWGFKVNTVNPRDF